MQLPDLTVVVKRCSHPLGGGNGDLKHGSVPVDGRLDFKIL